MHVHQSTGLLTQSRFELHTTVGFHSNTSLVGACTSIKHTCQHSDLFCCSVPYVHQSTGLLQHSNVHQSTGPLTRLLFELTMVMMLTYIHTHIHVYSIHTNTLCIQHTNIRKYILILKLLFCLLFGSFYRIADTRIDIDCDTNGTPVAMIVSK
jgi:hypothetical protein